MAGIARRVLVGLIILLFISIPFSSFALADGGVFSKYGELVYLDQSSQSAVICHYGGRQSMLISINFDWQDSDAVAWIFPIPSDPEVALTEIVDGAPTFYGRDVMEEARGELADSYTTYAFSYAFSSFSLWPVMMILTRAFLPRTGRAPAGSLSMEGGDGPGGSTVTIHSHIEKYGLVVELISATEGEGIYSYLTQEGLDISENVVPQLDDYVDKDYSFVVTWVEYSTDDSRELGVVVDFPTEKMFYPLMLTSVYGDDVIPMTVIVTEHVLLDLYPEIEPYANVGYFREGDVYLDWERQYALETERFVDRIQDNWNEEFTVIELSAPSNQLKDDLWMTSGTPEELELAGTYRGLFGQPASIMTLTLIGLGASLLAQLSAGGLYLGRRKENLPYYLALGIANLVGVLFLAIVASRLRQKMGIDKWKMVKFMGLFFVFFAMYSVLIFTIFILLIM